MSSFEIKRKYELSTGREGFKDGARDRQTITDNESNEFNLGEINYSLRRI